MSSASVMLAQTVVQALVVGVVEALLLQRPFEVPVDLNHEEEAWGALAHPPRRLGPEEWGALTPGALEDVGQDQHGHVAADAVALARDFQKDVDHRFLRRGVGVVKLQRVGPAGEVRIAAIRKDGVAGLALDRRVVLRSTGQVVLRAADEMLGMILDPRVAEPHVIGDEIEHEFQAALLETIAHSRQRCIAAKGSVNVVSGDGETGAGDVLVGKVWERFVKFPAPFGVAPRDLLRPRAGLPDAEQPYPVKTSFGQRVQLGIGDVVEFGTPAQRPRQFRQPDACVDLIEGWKTNGAHWITPMQCDDEVWVLHESWKSCSLFLCQNHSRSSAANAE